jgi:hypothetical protein
VVGAEWVMRACNACVLPLDRGATQLGALQLEERQLMLGVHAEARAWSRMANGVLGVRARGAETGGKVMEGWGGVR